MPTAYVLIRQQPEYRCDAFCAGLQAVGYRVVRNTGHYSADDVLCVWNRYGHYQEQALLAEQHGATVVVAENGYLGRDWLQGKEPSQSWYAISLNKHNTQPIRTGNGSRWLSFGAEIEPLQPVKRREIVLLPQRGIGQPGVAMPRDWEQRTAHMLKQRGFSVRIRQHPGKAEKTPLRDDIAGVFAVCTWASGAAVKAMLWGIPCLYDYRGWIAGKGGVHLSEWDGTRPLGDRCGMFERLAWGMWRVDEIASGEPFKELACC